jgi:hypothetical protein
MPRVYVIDTVTTNAAPTAELQGPSNVISAGIASGELRPIEVSSAGLDLHFHSEQIESTSSAHGFVFVAKYPSIELAGLLAGCAAGSSGFVFEHATLLCHLALLLRERGIAACVIPFDQLPPLGSLVKLDTAAPQGQQLTQIESGGLT